MIPEGFFKPGEEVPSGDDIVDTAVGWIDGYRMVYLHTVSSWDVYSPDVEGIFAGGDTRQKAEAHMRAALPGHLALTAAPVPAPTH